MSLCCSFLEHNYNCAYLIMSWKSKWNYFVPKYIICIIVFTWSNLPNGQLICAELRNEERTLRRKSNNAKRTKSCQRADLHTEVKVNELAVLNKLMTCKPSEDFPTFNSSQFENMLPFGKGSSTTFQISSIKRDGGRKPLITNFCWQNLFSLKRGRSARPPDKIRQAIFWSYPFAWNLLD